MLSSDPNISRKENLPFIELYGGHPPGNKSTPEYKDSDRSPNSLPQSNDQHSVPDQELVHISPPTQGEISPPLADGCKQAANGFLLPPIVLEEIIYLALQDLVGKARLRTLFGVSRASRYLWSVAHGASRLWAHLDTDYPPSLNEFLIRKSGCAPITIIYRLNVPIASCPLHLRERIVKERHHWRKVVILPRITYDEDEEDDEAKDYSERHSIVDSRGMDWLELIDYPDLSGNTAVISVGEGLGSAEYLDLEHCLLPINQVQIRSDKIKYLNIRFLGPSDNALTAFRDALQHCPNLHSLHLSTDQTSYEGATDTAAVSPLYYHHLCRLHLTNFTTSRTMELLSLIRSPALPSLKVDPLDPPNVRYPSPSPAWIYTNAATDSALSILLSRLRILNLECTKTRLDVFGAISVSHPRYHFSVDITSGPTNVISSILDLFDSSGVSVLWLMVHHEMVDLLVPRMLRDFGSMKVLTLFKCGNIDEALRLMGSYNVTSNTWCVPRLERFTIVDCQYEPHQLLKLIRARYVHDSQSSTQPDPLLSLQVAQLQDDFSLFQIKPDIKEEVESILGRDNVGWPVADEAELSTDSDSELEEDSEIDSDDEGISQPWRRARRVKPIERDYGSMDVPYYFRKGKRHH